MKQNSKVLLICEGAICAALSVALSSLKLFRMPQGGSITLEMAPLLFFALRRGVKWGALSGTISGLIQMLFGGYVVHPLQGALDYPIAFGVLGIAGAPMPHPIVAYILACVGRTVSHVLSGVIFFAEYAPEGQSPIIYSLIYNATVMIPNMIICVTVAWILHKRLARR